MKKYFLLTLILIVIRGNAFSQSSGWYFQNPKPTNMSLNNVKFLTQNDVIAVGYYGTLIRSTDAGVTWSNPLTTTSLKGFENMIMWNTSFLNSTTGFMIGNNEGSYTKVYKTTNAGNFWDPVHTFNGIGESIQFLNESTGWVSSSLFVFRTTNGGVNWDSNSVPMPSMVRGIFFTDVSTGYACVYRRIYKSTNGGTNWNMADSINADFTNLYFLNSNTGFVAGSFGGTTGLIRKTTDGGITWETKLSLSQTGILSYMNFINQTTGYVVGGGFSTTPGRFYKTTDSGNSWSLVPVNTKFHINSFSTSGSKIIAVGYYGKVIRSIDAGNSWQESQSFHIPGSTFMSVSFIDANTGWTTTGTSGIGIIYRTTNGGTTWEQIYSGAPYYIDKLQFFSANIGYYITGISVFKTTNGGFNWVQMPALNINSNGSKIDFYDINTGYAGGNSGNTSSYSRILRTTNGAQSWDTVKCVYDFCTNVSAVNFIDINTGWMNITYCIYPPQGIRSKIFRTTNSGSNWTELRNDSGYAYNIIDFKNSNTGWVVGGSRILSTLDGGYSWAVQQLQGSIRTLYMVNPTTGWINMWSFGGRLLKTTNSGLNWNTQLDLGSSGIMDLKFINEYTGWAVGTEGLIIKTTNGGDLVQVVKIENTVPRAFLLIQNYPNPFNPVTKIKFQIPLSRGVDAVGGRGVSTKLTIYDVLGKEVQILVNQQLKPGTYEVNWNAFSYSSGVYFYKLESGIFSQSKKMVLIK